MKLKKIVNHCCTSHLSAVDSDGNMVALTYTLLNRFGSKVVLPRTGILMNNSVSYFDPRPGYPTSLKGNKRINSSIEKSFISAGDFIFESRLGCMNIFELFSKSIIMKKSCSN